MRGRDSIRSIGHGDKKYSEEREREREMSRFRLKNHTVLEHLKMSIKGRILNPVRKFLCVNDQHSSNTLNKNRRSRTRSFERFLLLTRDTERRVRYRN